MRLGYCTNVHPGESLAAILGVIEGPVSRVRQRVAPDARLDVGLWLPCQVVDEVTDCPAAEDRLRESLLGAGLDVFTLNVFPYGGFHRQRVKEQVYAPSWLDPRRLQYTLKAAHILAALLGPSDRGSLSTLAGADRCLGTDPDTCQAIAGRLLEAAAGLWRLRCETGKRIAIALEPEPTTTMERGSDCVAFFKRYLLGKPAEDLARDLGLAADEGERLVREHLGVCIDTCHHAVLFDDLPGLVEGYLAAGIAVHKVQISNALELIEPHRCPRALERLWSFDEPRFLHQVVLLGGDGRTDVYRDLPRLRQAEVEWDDVRALRVHFHVPLFTAALEPLNTTVDSMRRIVGEVLSRGACLDFEVETYTWDVLPAAVLESFEGDGLVDGLAHELEFARDLLAGRSRPVP